MGTKTDVLDRSNPHGDMFHDRVRGEQDDTGSCGIPCKLKRHRYCGHDFPNEFYLSIQLGPSTLAVLR